MAKLETKPYWPVNDVISDNWRAEYEREMKQLDELRAKSDALPEGEIVGQMLIYPRGDGKAFYIVTKATPLTVAWVPFGDNWQVEWELIRGLTKASVLQQQRSQRSLSRIFGRA